jgi:hypothetical protein
VRWRGAAAAALLAAACASREPAGPTVLEEAAAPESPRPEHATLPAPGALELPFRPPSPQGARYRIVLELGGEEELAHPAAGAPPQRRSESQLLELEYREIPVRGRDDVLQQVLEGLHHRLAQQEPRALEREVEVAGDRLRTLEDGEVVLDLRGAQPSGDLTPRKLLDRVFAATHVDGGGNVVAVQAAGEPVARRFLAELPLRPALAYARPALPPHPVAVGASWSALRYPVSPAGRLGLAIPVRFLLSGVQGVEGIPCAWIIFDGRVEGENVPSAVGFSFERVLATLRGEAWVELASSEIRLLHLEDDVRASFQRADARGDPGELHRLRHATRLRLERREPHGVANWADGSERFGRR